MSRTISAIMGVRKRSTDQYVLEWDDDEYGEPTEANIIKALNDGLYPEIIFTSDGSFEEYVGVTSVADITDVE